VRKITQSLKICETLDLLYLYVSMPWHLNTSTTSSFILNMCRPEFCFRDGRSFPCLVELLHVNVSKLSLRSLLSINTRWLTLKSFFRWTNNSIMKVIIFYCYIDTVLSLWTGVKTWYDTSLLRVIPCRRINHLGGSLPIEYQGYMQHGLWDTCNIQFMTLFKLIFILGLYNWTSELPDNF
jgi:hypothetical protein